MVRLPRNSSRRATMARLRFLLRPGGRMTYSLIAISIGPGSRSNEAGPFFEVRHGQVSVVVRSGQSGDRLLRQIRPGGGQFRREPCVYLGFEPRHAGGTDRDTLRKLVRLFESAELLLAVVDALALELGVA